MTNAAGVMDDECTTTTVGRPGMLGPPTAPAQARSTCVHARALQCGPASHRVVRVQNPDRQQCRPPRRLPGVLIRGTNNLIAPNKPLVTPASTALQLQNAALQTRSGRGAGEGGHTCSSRIMHKCYKEGLPPATASYGTRPGCSTCDPAELSMMLPPPACGLTPAVGRSTRLYNGQARAAAARRRLAALPPDKVGSRRRLRRVAHPVAGGGPAGARGPTRGEVQRQVAGSRRGGVVGARRRRSSARCAGCGGHHGRMRRGVDLPPQRASAQTRV